MKYLLIPMLAVFALSVSAYADDDTQAQPAVQPSVLIKTAKVSERSVSENLSAFGSVVPAPREAITLAAPRESRVASLSVSSGEAVKKGQVLITLAPTPASSEAFVQAQSAADYAATALARARNLYKEHLATRDQVAAAEQASADAQVRLKNAQQAGGAGSLAIRATADGVVMTVAVNSGEQVAANTTLLTLVLRGATTVRLGVSPDQIAKIHIGMPVNLHDVYNPAIHVIAKVTNVSDMVDNNSGLTDVFVRLSGHVPGLMPGSYVQGTIVLRDTRGLAVPRSAVLTEGGEAYVFVVQGNVAHRVSVTTLADDGDWIAIKGDVKSNMEVVTLGNYELSDGMKIRKGSN
ncbi:MAG: efflux RND transporter periplasmic adaptor subunit [Gammaproteobacteria bacterium]